MEKAEDLNELRQRLLKEDWQVKLYDPLPPHVSEEQAAGLCLELVADHAERVRALLSAQPKVADAAKDLLLQEKDPKQMRQLAQALLDAGHAIKGNDKHPDSVKQLLDDRERVRQKKWQYKKEKCEKAKEKSEQYSIDLEKFPYARTKIFEPYLSLNPRYAPVHRNGELNSEGSRDECRHWTAAMQGDRATVKKLLQDAAQRRPVITDAHRKAGDSHKSVAGPGQVAFSRTKFGQLLATLVPQLRLQAGEEHSFLIISLVADPPRPGHALRLYIGREKQKQDGDPSPFFQIALFEPNLTGDRMHTTVMPEDLYRLQFDSFDVHKICQQIGAEILCIQMQNAELASQMAGHFVETDVKHQQLAFANAFYTINVAGMKAAVKELSGEGVHKLKATPAEQKAIFFMREISGTPGLYVALQGGHAGAIKALGEALIKFNLDSAEQKEIILAKSPNGTSGLYMALLKGHADAIKALGEILRQSNLDPAAQKEILLAKNHLGIPGLYVALENGDVDAIKAFGKILRQSNLAPADLKEILLAKDDRGIPGLHMALQNGHADAIKAFGKILRQSNLAPAEQEEVLFAKDHRGIPGLRTALIKDHVDAIKALGEILRQSGLNAAQLKEILLAKRASDGAPGLCVAFGKDNADAIKVMGDILQAASRDHRLDSGALTEILTPSADGINGLGWVFENGCLEAAQAYAEKLITLQEDPEAQLRGKDAQKVLDYLNEAMKQRGIARAPELESILLRAGTLLAAAAAA